MNTGRRATPFCVSYQLSGQVDRIPELIHLQTPQVFRIQAPGCRSETEATRGLSVRDHPTPKVLCPCLEIPRALTQAPQAWKRSDDSPRVASVSLRQPLAELRQPVGLEDHCDVSHKSNITVEMVSCDNRQALSAILRQAAGRTPHLIFSSRGSWPGRTSRCQRAAGGCRGAAAGRGGRFRRGHRGSGGVRNRAWISWKGRCGSFADPHP